MLNFSVAIFLAGLWMQLSVPLFFIQYLVEIPIMLLLPDNGSFRVVSLVVRIYILITMSVLRLDLVVSIFDFNALMVITGMV